MSTSGAPAEWDLTVPEDGAELLAELRLHGAEPGQRLHVALVENEHGGKRRSVMGVLIGKVPTEEVLSRDDFDATHQANIAAAERKYGTIGL